MTEGDAIAVQDLTVSLGGRDVLRGVSLGLGTGKVLAILGPNGAGKTTLLRVLATLLRPARGEVRLFGHDVRRDAVTARREVGYLGHQTFLYPQLSGWENLTFWARAYDIAARDRRVEEMLAVVGLEAYAHEPVRNYSRGMQQRLTLARALIHDPRLLLLDEPHTGLDRQAATLLDRVVRDWGRQGRAVVLTSHDASRALAISDQVLVLERGKVTLFVPSGEVGPEHLEAATAGATVAPPVEAAGGTRAGGGAGRPASPRASLEASPGASPTASPSGRPSWSRQVAALVWKDFRAESRSRESLTPMLVFALVVTTVFGFGLRGAGVDLRPVFPGLMWISLYFVGLFGLGRSFAAEKAQDTLAGLSLVPSASSFIFFGKLIANLLFLAVVEVVALPLMFGMLGVPFRANPGTFVAVVALGTVGFASVGTLMAALAANTRAGEMLLPILVFPVIVPSIIGAVEATSSLLGVGDPAAWSRWLGLLAAYDVLFVVVPWLVFDYLIEA